MSSLPFPFRIEVFAQNHKLQKGKKLLDWQQGPARVASGDQYNQIHVPPDYVEPQFYEQQQAARIAAEQRAKDADARVTEETIAKKNSALAFKNETGIPDEQWDDLQSRLKTPLTIAEKKTIFAQIGGARHAGLTSDALNRHAKTLEKSGLLKRIMYSGKYFGYDTDTPKGAAPYTTEENPAYKPENLTSAQLRQIMASLQPRRGRSAKTAKRPAAPPK